MATDNYKDLEKANEELAKQNEDYQKLLKELEDKISNNNKKMKENTAVLLDAAVKERDEQKPFLLEEIKKYNKKIGDLKKQINHIASLVSQIQREVKLKISDKRTKEGLLEQTIYNPYVKDILNLNPWEIEKLKRVIKEIKKRSLHIKSEDINNILF